MKLLHRRGRDDSLSCRQVGKVLQAFLDGQVDDVTAERVHEHLELCRRCGMEHDVYHQIKQSLSRAGAEVPETTLSRLRAFGERLAAGGTGDADDDV